MPRTFKPAARPNRTDLLTPAPPSPVEAPGQPNGQPVAVPTGLPYGEATQLAQAQQAAPLPGAPAVGAAPAGVAPAPVGAPAPGAALPPGAIEAATAFQPPPRPGLMNLAGDPNAILTSGLPTGAGPGPRAPFGGGPPSLLTQAAAVLNAFGAGTGAETSHIRDQITAAIANQANP